MQLQSADIKKFISFQKKEINHYLAYKKLYGYSKNLKDRKILKIVMNKEISHYNFWKKITGLEVKGDSLKVLVYFLISKHLGLNFGIQFMELDKGIFKKYESKLAALGDKKIIEKVKEQDRLESKTLGLIDKSELGYISSIILGLNDALVELTGALAGFTFAFNNPKTIAVAGLLTGIAASFSMGASEYLSTREGDGKEVGKKAVTASFYTGFTYFVTVVLLIFPFFVLDNSILSLNITLLIAILLIFLFNFYISVAKNLSFIKRSSEMIFISLGVAVFNFVLGMLIKNYFKIS